MSDPSIDSSLLIQIGTAIGAIIAGGAATWVGLRSKAENSTLAPERVAANRVFPQDARFFFDGPIGRILEFLQGIYRNSAEFRTEAQRHHDEMRGDLGEIIDLLSNGRPVKRTRRHRPR